MSALFIGWGLLVGYDLFLNEDNSSEPLDIACNNASIADVWCPLGSLSELISFNRSNGEIEADGGGVRNPINYATAYIDLDWLYGRDEESAGAIRTLDAGTLNLTADDLPHSLPDGTWLVSAPHLWLETRGMQSESTENKSKRARTGRAGVMRT